MALPPPKPAKPGINVSEEASNNLWVGNLAPEATDTDLMNVFAKYGALDSITTYSRSYAFVFFKRAEDAAAAKDSLQGTVVRGIPLKIEFARPARPSRNLWVGGISPSVTKEQLEEEFLKFGEILEFKFLRERNTACIEFGKLEDATQAMRELNGKRVDGEQIRVDFLRSLPLRRDQPPDFQDGPAAHPGRAQQPSWGRKEGPPSKVLWIGFPPSVQIDDQMLHNAMILFGEIERISSYPARHFSFVEFRSIDEARRAKEGLQGRLFNDPRITIMFSNSELAPGKGNSGFHPALRNARGGMFDSRSGEREIFDRRHPMGLNNFPGQLPPGSINRSNLPMRPFPPQSNVDSVHPGPEFTDLAAGRAFQDRNTNLSPDPSWKRQSPPTSGLLPSPASGFRPPLRPDPRGWDVLELDQLQREPKRSRIEAPLSSDDGVPGPYSNIIVDNSPHGAFGSIGRQVQDQLDKDYIWRGIIAKGGQPVCHARCVPIGKGIDAKLPEVVNCSARTGLDLLAQHYAEAVGFDIIFFLPDDEDDFEPYTEFLRYLSSKNRAGVAKLEDGTTLFLVPPSDFLTDVLKFEGPPRLYGVVLKRTQQMPIVASVQPPLCHPSHGPHVGRHLIPSAEADSNFIPHKDDYVIPAEHDVPPKSLYPPANQSTVFSSVASPSLYPSTSNTSTVPQIPQDYKSTNNVAASQSGVSLTPELIATLATLLPAKVQSSALQTVPPAPGPSFPQPSLSSAIPDGGSQVWKHDDQVSGALNPSQSGNQFNAWAEVQNQFQHYPSVPNIPTQSEYMVTNAQIQHPNMSMPYQATIPSMPLTSLAVPSPSGQPSLSSAVSQQHQLELPHGAHRDYRMAQGAALPGAYNPSATQQPNLPSALYSQVLTTNYAHAQPEISASAENVNYVPQNHSQQFQTSLQGGQSASESEVDKNQRYQSTLNFAANLLMQIQQKQQRQQTNNQSAQGSGNPQ